jgi:hypothetical protein
MPDPGHGLVDLMVRRLRRGRIPPNANHLEGRTYGQWLVVGLAGSGYGNGERVWRCESQTRPGVVRIMTAGKLRRSADRAVRADQTHPGPAPREPAA